MKNDRLYLEHISDAVSRIVNYTNGFEYQDFIEDLLVQDACIRQLEIIGEATKHLSAEVRAQYSHIPWKDIAGMRDILIHDYLNVDLDLVWKTVNEKIPELKSEIKPIMDDLAK